jgi:hypothetical protein
MGKRGGLRSEPKYAGDPLVEKDIRLTRGAMRAALRNIEGNTDSLRVHFHG